MNQGAVQIINKTILFLDIIVSATYPIIFFIVKNKFVNIYEQFYESLEKLPQITKFFISPFGCSLMIVLPILIIFFLIVKEIRIEKKNAVLIYKFIIFVIIIVTYVLHMVGIFLPLFVDAQLAIK